LTSAREQRNGSSFATPTGEMKSNSLLEVE